MATSKLVLRLARAGKCTPASRAYRRLDKNRYTDNEIATMRAAVHKACGLPWRARRQVRR
jgi:hypothetical protein